MEYYPKKNIWKWILLYVLIGAVAYGLIYYFYFSKNGGYNYNPKSYQTKNNSVQTTDWKIYTNDQYGFEFKYPQEVIIEASNNMVKVHDKRSGYLYEWNMKFYKNEDKKSLESWINSQFSSFSQQSDKDCKIVPSDKYGLRVNIKNGYTVLIDAPSYEASCNHVGYYTISPDNLTIMRFDNVQASPELYKDILSTFKFTK